MSGEKERQIFAQIDLIGEKKRNHCHNSLASVTHGRVTIMLRTATHSSYRIKHLPLGTSIIHLVMVTLCIRNRVIKYDNSKYEGCFIKKLQNVIIFTGRQHSLLCRGIACYAEPCISYNRVVQPSVHPSHAGNELK